MNNLIVGEQVTNGYGDTGVVVNVLESKNWALVQYPSGAIVPVRMNVTNAIWEVR